MRLLAVIATAFALATPAFAQTSDEAAIRDTLARWYECHAKEKAGCRYWMFLAPGGIDAGPGIKSLDDGKSAALRGPWINNELAANALQFSFDVERLKLNTDLARVDVWERGYFYAFVAQTTYETAADALFVMEKQPDGRWLILVHEASSQGIPPGKHTEPMPDLRELYYSQNPTRDPAKDAAEASKF